MNYDKLFERISKALDDFLDLTVYFNENEMRYKFLGIWTSSNFGKNIQQNLVRQERFYTTHQVYDYNHLVNQILYKALKVLKTISNNSFLIDTINRLLLDFPGVKELEINKTHFDKLIENRKTAPYNEAIKITKMILLNYSPDIKGGDENMLALLFDMNKL